MLEKQNKKEDILAALIRLSRYKEYALHISILTLFAARLSGGYFNLQLVLLVIANVIGLTYVYMLNDVEDAPDDLLDPWKRARNPVANGDLTKNQAYFACFIAASLAVLFYSAISRYALILGILMLVVATLGTVHVFRLKGHFAIDVLGHSFVIGVSQYLISYFTILARPASSFWPALLAVGLFSIYIELWQETRDMTVDKKAGLRTSASLLSERGVNLVVSILIVAIVFLLCLSLATSGAPAWFLVIWASVFLIPFGYRLLLYRPRSLPDLVKGSHNRNVLTLAIGLLVWYSLPLFKL